VAKPNIVNMMNLHFKVLNWHAFLEERCSLLGTILLTFSLLDIIFFFLYVLCSAALSCDYCGSFSLWTKMKNQMKIVELYSPVILFIMPKKVVLTLESVDEIP